MPPERMLTFASQVVSRLQLCFGLIQIVNVREANLGIVGLLQAGIGCRALGARAGLPHLTDPRLRPFLMNVATLL